MPTDPSAHDEPDTRSPDPSDTTAATSTGTSTDGDRAPTLLERLGADWAAVIIAGALVVLAGLGLLPSIPFLIK